MSKLLQIEAVILDTKSNGTELLLQTIAKVSVSTADFSKSFRL